MPAKDGGKYSPERTTENRKTILNAIERSAYLDDVLRITEPMPAETQAVIREQMLDQFSRELDAKLNNLQQGEMLTMMFRIEIVGQNGTVRGGRNRDRNMPEYIQWRSAVYERDRYRCVECGSKKSIVAHHVKMWAHHPGLRFDIDNGVTLCGACHQLKHPHLGFVRNGNT